ncbi:olfactory receptor 2T3-like [Dendropsophus ebraccatus]|uniref:olfactory receptor 2T3-like n=1 Tax=Dendropsophus ebraccatus TaxID=150705 RepID=UPI003831571E
MNGNLINETLGIFLIYLLSMLGNLTIVAVVFSAPRLHTPMYFFLCNLSIQDIVYASSVLPKLLVIQITGDTRTSFLQCFTQIFVFVACVDTEFYLLAPMAVDRYIAICMPLKYSTIMSKTMCTILALASWTSGLLSTLLFVILISHLSFCDSKHISRFFCDVKVLLKLSCSDVTLAKTMIFIELFTVGLLPLAMIVTSYSFIISIILKIKTSARRKTVFSSCSSYLMVVFLFFGTSISIYMKPDSERFTEVDMMLSLLYVAVVPALNPLVYSLRNREVMKALSHLLT